MRGCQPRCGCRSENRGDAEVIEGPEKCQRGGDNDRGGRGRGHRRGRDLPGIEKEIEQPRKFLTRPADVCARHFQGLLRDRKSKHETTISSYRTTAEDLATREKYGYFWSTLTNLV